MRERTFNPVWSSVVPGKPVNKSALMLLFREYRRLPRHLRHLSGVALVMLGFQLTYLVLDVVYDMSSGVFAGSFLDPILRSLEGAPTAPFYLVCTVTYLAALYSVLNFKQQGSALFTEAVNTNSIVMRLNPDTTVIEANQYFCDLLKVYRSAVPGTKHSSFVKDEVRASEAYRAFWDKLRSGVPSKGTYERVASDGTSVWVTGSYIPLKGRDGAVFEIVKVANDVTDQINDRIDLKNKNTYLEHAAKILRHDMHSGINTYIPRGIRSLERRLASSPGTIQKLRLYAPLRMLKEGLVHTQKVYRGVTEFTNLVRDGVDINMVESDLREILVEHLDTTSYKAQVQIGSLPSIPVNVPLFCTAVDNLIRNGLKYNDSPTRWVKVQTSDESHVAIIDNGRGMCQREFDLYSKPYTRKEGQAESGSGLGLNICVAILAEHGFSITCQENEGGGTTVRIKVR
jgi:signal transduction histidine kinase